MQENNSVRQRKQSSFSQGTASEQACAINRRADGTGVYRRDLFFVLMCLTFNADAGVVANNALKPNIIKCIGMQLV
jgi:hypothetical protein